LLGFFPLTSSSKAAHRKVGGLAFGTSAQADVPVAPGRSSGTASDPSQAPAPGANLHLCNMASSPHYTFRPGSRLKRRGR
jgi:hypothetical protein